MLNALVASGLPTQPFMFYGFLSAQSSEQTKELYAIKEYPQTLIFYEAPHRIKRTLMQMQNILGNRRICLARELTKRHEEFLRGTISEILEVCDECKGEMVLVVEGCEPSDKTVNDMAIIYQQINQCIAAGLSSMEAIKKIAKETGLSKNDLYRQYHEWNELR